MSLEHENQETPESERLDFEALTRQHQDSVYRQMVRVCGNREDAEDVLVEAPLKAYRHLNQLRDSAAFRAWLAQIAKRVCWQLKEREALLPLLQLSTLEEEGQEIAGGELSPEAQLARQEMKQLLDDALAALPESYRRVYQMRDVEDRAGDKVAKTLAISRAAMKSRLHRARDLVRTHVDMALTRASSNYRFYLEALMEVTIEHLGALQFEINARQHSIACDQPAENGGHDEGMTPPELLLASLGSCAGFYAAQYLRKYDLATAGTRVRVKADKLKDPARIDNFRIEIDSPVELSEQHRAGVERAVHHCLIHNTLLHPPQMGIEINCPVPSEALAD